MMLTALVGEEGIALNPGPTPGPGMRKSTRGARLPCHLTHHVSIGGMRWMKREVILSKLWKTKLFFHIITAMASGPLHHTKLRRQRSSFSGKKMQLARHVAWTK